MELRTEVPLVSVIMPIRNEEKYIERSLRSVLSQDYPWDRIEVIIADGMSTDRTREILRTYTARFKGLRVVDNPGRIVSTGLNQAIRQAKGEVIVRVDGHCEIPPHYINGCEELLSNLGADCVGGPIETIGETYCGEAIALSMSSAFGVGGSAFRVVSDRTLPTNTVPFAAYRREALELAGFFDEELVRNQDDEYHFRLAGLGGKIMLSPRLRSKYYGRRSLRSLWRQFFRYGYWKVRVLQKHPKQSSLRHFIPPLFVVSLLGTTLFGLVSLKSLALLAAILSLYVIANLVGSLFTAARGGWRYLPVLPLAFAVLHLSYGIGFLVGLINFAGRWNDKDGKVPGSPPDG